MDDEAASRAIIAHLVDQVPSLELMGQFSHAIEAIKFLNKNEVDLVFLDIHMPDFTGFDFIDTLKEPPAIVLTTSDRNFAIEAFEYSCIVDYLVKPVELSRFQKAVDKVVARAAANASKHEITIDGKTYRQVNTHSTYGDNGSKCGIDGH